MAEQAKTTQPSFWKSRFFKSTLRVVLAVILTASLLLNLFTFVMPVVRYYGSDMSPALTNGQILIVSKMAKIEEGDIIAFYYNNKVLVRRVIATGSQQVSIDSSGAVSVNGQVLSEDYIQTPALGQCNLSFPYTVPANAFFVLGDDRQTSMDSRLQQIGAISEDRILGKVVFSLNPFRSVN